MRTVTYSRARHTNGIVSVSGVSGETTIDLTIARSFAGDIEIQRRLSVGPGSWASLPDISGSVHNDTGLLSSTSYDYRLRVKNTNWWKHITVVTEDETGVPDTITVEDLGWMHADLTWDNSGYAWNAPWVLQRKTAGSWATPNLSLPQHAENNFIFVGMREAWRYTDLGLEPGTAYQWRVAPITNFSDYVRYGTTPTFGTWQTGSATTGTRSGSWPTVSAAQFESTYGAAGDGVTNDWDAFQAVATAFKSAGGGELQLGAKTYLAWPTGDDVIENPTYGKLTVVVGQNRVGSMFNGQMSNVKIVGTVDGNGAPTSKIVNKLWFGREGTEYLTVLKTAGGNPDVYNDIYRHPTGDPQFSIRRYGFWTVSADGVNVQNVVLKNVHVDMTAIPVSAGKGWYSYEEARTQWDQTQKLVYGFHKARNIYLENVKAENIRGEIAYWGGFGCGKYKMVGCDFRRSNSSIVSMSADAEYEDCYFGDFANAGIESAPHATNGVDGNAQLVSVFSGNDLYQDTIARGCTFEPLIKDPAERHMLDMPDLNTADVAASGIHIFNQKRTFQTVTDCVIKTCWDTGFAPWYECENVFVWDLTIDDPYGSERHMISFNPRSGFYDLTGGQEYVYMTDIKINLVTQGITNGGSIMYVSTGLACMNNHIFEKFTVNCNGHSITRLWQDDYESANGRSNFIFRDWTFNSLGGTQIDQFIQNLATNPNGRPLPQFENVNFNYLLRAVTEASADVLVDWGYIQIENYTTDNDYDIHGIPNLQALPVGGQFKFKNSNGADTVRWPASSDWNTWTTEKVVTGSQILTTQVVNTGSGKRLQFVSLA